MLPSNLNIVDHFSQLMPQHFPILGRHLTITSPEERRTEATFLRTIFGNDPRSNYLSPQHSPREREARGPCQPIQSRKKLERYFTLVRPYTFFSSLSDVVNNVSEIY